MYIYSFKCVDKKNLPYKRSIAPLKVTFNDILSPTIKLLVLVIFQYSKKK